LAVEELPRATTSASGGSACASAIAAFSRPKIVLTGDHTLDRRLSRDATTKGESADYV
jgi:hypothetical protein